MEELLQLIEELVVNKIRIEKVQEETTNLEVKRVLGQEVQTVSKIQEVVKKIQTESMSIIYDKMKEQFGSPFDAVDLSGKEAEFDNFNEKHIFNILNILIKNIIESTNEKIILASHNDSSNLILEIISNKTGDIESFMAKQKQAYLSITSLPEAEIEQWIKPVYSEIKLINGSVEIFAEEDINQKIIITVPLASTIIKAQLVEINNLTYAIPMDCIEKVMNIDTAEKRTSNGVSLVNYMGSIIPVIPIDKTLGFNLKSEFSNYVVLKFNNRMKVLPVNSLLEQTDVVVRSKPKVLSDVKEFKGMAVLGDGYVTMVFDIAYLLGN